MSTYARGQEARACELFASLAMRGNVTVVVRQHRSMLCRNTARCNQASRRALFRPATSLVAVDCQLVSMRAAKTDSYCIIGVVVIDATHTSSSLIPTMSRRQERRRDEGDALPVASLRGSERLTRHTETNSLGKIQ